MPKPYYYTELDRITALKVACEEDFIQLQYEADTCRTLEERNSYRTAMEVNAAYRTVLSVRKNHISSILNELDSTFKYPICLQLSQVSGENHECH